MMTYRVMTHWAESEEEKKRKKTLAQVYTRERERLVGVLRFFHSSPLLLLLHRDMTEGATPTPGDRERETLSKKGISLSLSTWATHSKR